MAAIRIRVQFEKTIPLRSPYNNSTQSGQDQSQFITLINITDYFNLADLQIYLLKKFARKGYSPKTAIRMYIGGALAESNESISIIRDNDLIQISDSNSRNTPIVRRDGDASSRKALDRSEDSGIDRSSDTDSDTDSDSESDKSRKDQHRTFISKTPSSSTAKTKIHKTPKSQDVMATTTQLGSSSSPSPSTDAKFVWNFLREKKTLESREAEASHHDSNTKQRDAGSEVALKSASCGKKRRRRSSVRPESGRNADNVENLGSYEGVNRNKFGQVNRASTVFVSASLSRTTPKATSLPSTLPAQLASDPSVQCNSFPASSSSYDEYPAVRINEKIVGCTVAFTRCYLGEKGPTTSDYIVGKIIRLAMDSSKFSIDVCLKNTLDAIVLDRCTKLSREETETNGVEAVEFEINGRPKVYAFDCREVVVMRLVRSADYNDHVEESWKHTNENDRTNSYCTRLPAESLEDALARRKQEVLASIV